MKIISSLPIGLLNWTTDGILGRLSDEQETIKHPSVVSGCVRKLFATKYKNAVVTIFYKIQSAISISLPDYCFLTHYNTIS